MNGVARFLEANAGRLGLDGLGAGGPLASVIVTPRFHASSHVVFLLVPEGGRKPVLVAKAPRLGGPSGTLAREADNLRRLHAGRPGGCPGAPRLVAYEDFDGWPILVETAVDGRAYDRATVRRDTWRAASLGAAWLIDLATGGPRFSDGPAAGVTSVAAAFDRLVERPLAALADLPLDAGERALVERTRALAAPLAGAASATVFEHGDFSAPNVLATPGGGIGVVDWELAEPEGLPAADLFFWLTYVAFARAGATTLDDQRSAFRAAFFGPAAWTRPHVLRYADRLALSPELLTAAFVATWARTVAGLVGRLTAAGAAWSARADGGTLDWLRGNRYFRLWRDAVAHAPELGWAGPHRPAAGRRPRLAARPLAEAAARW